MKKKKYKDGGFINKIGGALAESGISAGADLLLPGLGTAASFVMDKLLARDAAGEEMKNKIEANANPVTNPYQLQNGGMLQGSADAAMYKGNSHSNGGIGVNTMGIPSPNTPLEVEGEEFKINLPNRKTYVFSKKLKV